jgi:DNA-binding transcriptional LysR family regulator
VPARMSRPLLRDYGMRTLPLPVDVPPVPVILVWHQRYDGDRAHIWLRDLVRSALREAIGVIA